jgi:hypothetical protein
MSNTSESYKQLGIPIELTRATPGSNLFTYRSSQFLLKKVGQKNRELSPTQHLKTLFIRLINQIIRIPPPPPLLLVNQKFRKAPNFSDLGLFIFNLIETIFLTSVNFTSAFQTRVKNPETYLCCLKTIKKKEPGKMPSSFFLMSTSGLDAFFGIKIPNIGQQLIFGKLI